MTSMKKSFSSITLAVMCLFVLGTAAAFAQRHFMMSASARPQIKVKLSGAVERDGAQVPIEASTSVRPGEVLDWTIISENEGSSAAHEYKAVGQIPRGTQLIMGSTSSDGSAKVVYSIDNGRTFSAQPTIEERQPDGSVKQVPAPVSMYTNLRYEWSDPLAQGAHLTASYKVRVK